MLMWSIAPDEDYIFNYPLFCHVNTENIEYWMNILEIFNFKQQPYFCDNALIM